MKTLFFLACFTFPFVSSAQVLDTFKFDDTQFQSGQIHTLKNIRFSMGEVRFYYDHEPNELDSLADFLCRNDSLIIRLESHSDTRGHAAQNKILTTNTSVQIARYLYNKGIDPSRILVFGIGEEAPVIPEDSINQFRKTDKQMFEWLHQKNRRHTVIIEDIRGSHYLNMIPAVTLPGKSMSDKREDGTSITYTYLGLINHDGQRYGVALQESQKSGFVPYGETNNKQKNTEYRLLILTDGNGQAIHYYDISNDENTLTSVENIRLETSIVEQPKTEFLNVWIGENIHPYPEMKCYIFN